MRNTQQTAQQQCAQIEKLNICFCIMGDNEVEYIVNELRRIVQVRRTLTDEPFDFHRAILNLDLGQGVRNTLEDLLLNNVEIGDEITAMAVMGHFTEKIRRNLRVNMNYYSDFNEED